MTLETATAVPLIAADARTASEVWVAEESLADRIKQPGAVDLTGIVSHCPSMPVNGTQQPAIAMAVSAVG
jgi:hypothetical protein